MGSIDDIMQLCRLCLVKDQVNIPIFDEASDIRQTFLKINSCLPVKVSQDDNLPKKICDGCSYKLDMLYIFRNTSVDSEKQLLSWLNQAGLGACSLPQSAVKDGGTKPEIMVKQETFESTDSRIEEENPEMCADAHSYIIQQQKLPYQQEFGFGEASGSTEMVVEEPAPKRAKRAAAMKKHVPIETDEDELDTAMQITKAEEDDSDDIDQPDYVEAPSTSADDQPGPSGVGKGAIEAPFIEEYLTCEKDEWHSSVTVGGSVKEEGYIDNDPLEIIEESTSAETEETENAAALTSLTERSRNRYLVTYERFNDWCREKFIDEITEKNLLTYFTEKSEVAKCSTLWTEYSMLKATLFIKNNIDISKMSKLIAFLKRKSEGYKPKKANIFSRNDINKFLEKAPDDTYLMMKVVLMMGIAGGCSRDELKNITVDNIEDAGSVLIVTIPDSRIKIQRKFIITNGEGPDLLQLYRKYAALRPLNINHKRFFLYYKSGKCSCQPVGVNIFGKIPQKIAAYLELPNASSYTGHSFRRSSATLLVNSAGGDITTIRNIETRSIQRLQNVSKRT